VQKQVSIDDDCLLFGICCLISSVGVLFTVLDPQYLLEALLYGAPNLELPPDWIPRALVYRNAIAVALILS
jgi:hypothetical protein